jgi:hypothetical protein
MPMIGVGLIAFLLSLDLEAYRWKNRILLQFNGPAVPAVIPAGFAERDLLWFRSADPDLRKRFGAGTSPLWILIGKDGSPKARWSKVPSPDQLFGLIDAMPMRQAEMRRP